MRLDLGILSKVLWLWMWLSNVCMSPFLRVHKIIAIPQTISEWQYRNIFENSTYFDIICIYKVLENSGRVSNIQKFYGRLWNIHECYRMSCTCALECSIKAPCKKKSNCYENLLSWNNIGRSVYKHIISSKIKGENQVKSNHSILR